MTSRWPARLRALRPTLRDALAGALVLAFGSGWWLAPSFDAHAGLRSIATWLLLEPVHAWARAVHAWSACVAVAATLAIAWRQARAGRPKRGKAGRKASNALDSSDATSVLIANPDPAAHRSDPVPSGIPPGSHRLSFASIAGLIGLAVITGYLLRGDSAAVSARGAAQRLVGADLLGAPALFFVHVAVIPLALLATAAACWRRSDARTVPAISTGLVIAVIAAIIQPDVTDVGWRGGAALAGGFGVREGPVLAGNCSMTGDRGPVTIVRGRPEGCLVCHGAMTGFSPGHRPEVIGCVACHGGDAFARAAAPAHRGLIRVPGNLADAPRTCAQAGCHDDVAPRVSRSIMTTLAGVIAVDRAAFGEPPRSVGDSTVRHLTQSPADKHLRQLCASCHLGQSKEQWGANGDESRGGGCLACHLVYSDSATRELERYRSGGYAVAAPAVHPRLSVNPPDENCFGCHSRSGRIATNYAGWRELGPIRGPASQPEAARVLRTLGDGRTFADAPPDVHHERGLACIDCHTAAETMGRGMVVGRRFEQQEVRCEDCHTLRRTPIGAAALPAEAAKILQLRGVTPTNADRFAVTRSGDPLINVTIDAAGRATLRRKADGAAIVIKPAAGACARGAGHRRLSCESCHTAWASRCVSCHTRYEPNAEAFDHVAQRWETGAWVETGGDFQSVAPTLGVRQSAAAADAGTIETFAPGMVLTIEGVGFQRLYARVAPHTTQRESRSCVSCHASPVALGYGEGELTYRADGASGQWSFTPSRPLAADGLPVDAWIGMLQNRTTGGSTRDDVRPLSTVEQQRVLRVGACLTCHAGDSPPMRAALDDFPATFARRSDKCSTPW